MTLLCSPEDRCSHSISAFGVDVGPFLDEEMAKSFMVIDGSPLLKNGSVRFHDNSEDKTYVERSNALLILVIGVISPTVEKFLNCANFA